MLQKISRRFITALSVLLTLSLCAVPLFAQSFNPIDAEFVDDAEQILSDDAISQINKKVASLYEANGSAIYVLSVEDTGSMPISQSAADVFKDCEPGANSSLLVVSANGSDYYLYCGSAAASELTSDELKTILSQNMEENFAAGEIDSAVTATVNALYDRQIKFAVADAGETPLIVKIIVALLVILLIAAFLIVLFIVYIRARNRKMRSARRRRMIASGKVVNQAARKPAKKGKYNFIDIPRDEDDRDVYISYVNSSDDQLIL